MNTVGELPCALIRLMEWIEAFGPSNGINVCVCVCARTEVIFNNVETREHLQ